jgi:asparagine synthetase B (glutamine-hydrolysing)
VSRLAALWRFDEGPWDPDTVERVRARLGSRDDEVTQSVKGSAVLLHRTPLTSFAGVVLIADVRLDNRDELIGALSIGTGSDQSSDGHLILHAWERWGEECPARLLGDFAFVLFDPRRNLLFSARDATGMRPL